MNELFSYKKFTSRNYLYINDELQDKIKSTRITFFGTGLSSSIAEYCARLGFMHMSFIDGDQIEVSNLNRQSFNFDEVGFSKAETLKSRILKINPLCNIISNTSYVSEINNIQDQINVSDIIINTVDCNQIYFDIIEYARTKDKLVICPFNPGFSGLIICFTKKSAASHEVFDLDLDKKLDDIEIARQLFTKYPEIKTLSQASATLDEFLANASSAYFPQIAVGALFTAAITLTTIIKFLENKPITLAPSVIYLNCY